MNQPAGLSYGLWIGKVTQECGTLIFRPAWNGGSEVGIMTYIYWCRNIKDHQKSYLFLFIPSGIQYIPFWLVKLSGWPEQHSKGITRIYINLNVYFSLSDWVLLILPLNTAIQYIRKGWCRSGKWLAGNGICKKLWS